jgi:hypothetical protein
MPPWTRRRPRWPARSLALALAAAAAWAPAEGASLPDVDPASLLQWECYQLVISVCVCGWPPHPCVFVTYWEPTLLVNTSEFVGYAGQALARFHEARVWPFPVGAVDPAGCLFPCRSGLAGLTQFMLLPYFLSDVDPMWRVGDHRGHEDLGAWGRLGPRAGWVHGTSSPVTSGMAFYRAVSVADDPGAHVVLRRSGVAASTGNNINLGYPRLSPCLTPGADPRRWEAGSTSVTGQYLWVYWTRKACCIEASQICSGGGGLSLAQAGPLGQVCRQASASAAPAAAPTAGLWARGWRAWVAGLLRP